MSHKLRLGDIIMIFRKRVDSKPENKITVSFNKIKTFFKYIFENNCSNIKISVHGWRHFLVCNTHHPELLAPFPKWKNKFTWGKTREVPMYCISSASERKHEIACTSWSSCLWKLCELVSNVEEQLWIVFM
jgi:hypothetical protein